MTTPTYIPLATVTLTSPVTTVTISNIPGTFRDLILIASARNAQPNAFSINRVNGDTANNYNRQQLIGQPSGSSAGVVANENALFASFFGNATFSANVYQYMDYSATDKHKTILMRTNINDLTMASANRYASTAAITSISFQASGANFLADSTFDLYGIQG